MREAIEQVNTGVFTRIDASAINGAINLATPLPTISSTVEIQGPGSTLLTVSGGGGRVFTAGDGTNMNVIIRDLAIANGVAPSSGPDAGRGGGIFVQTGTHLQTNNLIFLNNNAPGGAGGAIFVSPGATMNVIGSSIDGTQSAGSNPAPGAAGPQAISGGGAVFLDAGANARITVESGTTQALESSIGGQGGLQATGSGTLRLVAPNSFTGGATIDGGTVVEIASDAALGAEGGLVTLDDATLRFTGNVVSARPMELEQGNNFFDVQADTTLAGVVSGDGGFVKTGGGTLRMQAIAQFLGPTDIATGTLQAGTNDFLPETAVTIASGAALDLNGFTDTVGSIAGSGQILLGSGALTAGVDNTSTVYGGVISGTGSFAKAGTGTLILSGANTYSGGTAVTGGTLQGNTTSLQGNIVNGSNVVFDQAVNGSYAGVMSGTGTVVKQGAGSLSIDAAQTYTGGTTVAAGRLAVNNTIQSDVTVNAGAEIGGRGAVRNLTVGGRLAPGNSIDTITVNGNLTQSTGSTFDVEIESSGSADRVNVTGAATIQPGVTLNVLSAPGTYRAGTQYTILSAAGGISGSYTNFNEDLPFFDISLIQQSNAILLQLFRNATAFQTVALTLNQKGVAASLDRASRLANDDFFAVESVVSTFNANATRDALDQMAGEAHASAPTISFQDNIQVNQSVLRRLRRITPSWAAAWSQPAAAPAIAAQGLTDASTLGAPPVVGEVSEPAQQVEPAGAEGRTRSVRKAETSEVLERLRRTAEDHGGSAAGPAGRIAAGAGALTAPYAGAQTGGPADEWSTWAEGYGYRTAADGNSEARAFAFDGQGLLVGADRAWNLRTQGGMFAGTSDSDGNVAGRFDRTRVETFRLGLYGRHEIATGPFSRSFLSGVVTWADNDYDTSRRLVFGGIDRQATASYGGNTFSSNVELSRLYRHRGWEIEPAASLQYARVRTGGFGETGAGSLNLIGAGTHNDSVLGVAGARFTYPTEKNGRRVVPELRARYMHEFHNDIRLATAALEGAPGLPFTIRGTSTGRNFAVLGGGLTYQAGRDTHAYLNYDAQLSGKQDTHAGEAGVRLAF